METANPQKRQDGWVDHIAIAVEDIESVRKMLEDRGVEFETKEVLFGESVFLNGTNGLPSAGRTESIWRLMKSCLLGRRQRTGSVPFLR